VQHGSPWRPHIAAQPLAVQTVFASHAPPTATQVPLPQQPPLQAV
jgi:hypothetical protein